MTTQEIEISQQLLTGLLSLREYHTGEQRKAYNMQISVGLQFIRSPSHRLKPSTRE